MDCYYLEFLGLEDLFFFSKQLLDIFIEVIIFSVYLDFLLIIYTF